MNIRKLAFCITSIFLTCFASAEEWSAPIGKKALSEKTKTVPGKIIPGKLDFGAYSTQSDLVVFVRNGKHKMGAKSIQIDHQDSVASLLVQRVSIAKPLTIVQGKGDGSHLFESFTCSGKAYEIHYHIKDGKLVPKVTVSSKS